MTPTDPPPVDGDEPPVRRPTPTERYHELALLAASRQQTVPEHALELTLNAKGDVQIALTVRGSDLDTVESDACATFDRLREKYPRTAAPDARP